MTNKKRHGVKMSFKIFISISLKIIKLKGFIFSLLDLISQLISFQGINNITSESPKTIKRHQFVLIVFGITRGWKQTYRR